MDRRSPEAYDLCGARIVRYYRIELHKPTTRIVERVWPDAITFEDVRALDETTLKQWLGEAPEWEEVHLWGGFPCKDLSPAKAYRRNLEGEHSSLFYEFLRVLKILRVHAGGRL